MSLVSQGLAKNLIKLDDEQKYITYVHQNKKRNYTNPEERVQAETFLKLILTYGYDQKRIRLFVPVTIGSTTKEADIIVYNDDELTSAHIVVECKKEEVSESEFTQAVSQAFSYAATGTVRAKYFWVTSNIKDICSEIPENEPKKYQGITDIPQYGVDKLARYKYAKGGGVSGEQKLYDLNVVTEDELTRCFKQAHQSLWGGGELNPSSAFDELDKLIFCKIWDEKKARKQGEPYDFQIFSVAAKPKEKEEDRLKRENKELSDRVKALYEEGRLKDTEVFKDDIRLNLEKLRTVVEYLQKLNLSDTDLDCKGRAFETFMGSFFRGDFGQYFTPRPIVKFIVDTLPINHNSLVLDTSCGSGGFLLHALDKVRKEANEYYPNYVTNPKESNQHYKHWHDFAEHNLFGIEINEQIARVAKMNMIIHDDGHTNVIASDGLRDSKDLIERSGNKGFAYNRFNFIITNPPFGSVIKQTEQAYMNQYGFAMKAEDWLNPKSKSALRDNQNTEVLFIEQCHNFLVDGGYLAMVVPDGILTNSSLQYVRDGIEDKYRIVAVVSMPQTAFSATGAGVKSSVLFLKKYSQAMTEKIQNQKVRLQDDIKKSNDYLQQLAQIESDKKQHLKNLTGFENPQNLSGKVLTDSEAYKEWRRSVTAEYADRIDALKESLNEQYAEEKQKALGDYPIFMAIAEDIGYDATGKPTNNNELDLIGVELTRFIEAVERGEDSFFLSSDVDETKVFLINWSLLNGRLDPFFNLAQIKSPIRSCFPIQRLKSIIYKSMTGGTPSKSIPKYWLGNIPWISSKDFKQFYLSDSEDHITQEAIDNSSTNIAPVNSLLIVFRSSILIHSIPVGIAQRAMAINQDVKALVFTENTLPNYVGYFINIFQGQILPLITKQSTTVQSINSEQFINLNIPIPPLSIQKRIIAKMDAAYSAKKQKEAEAQRSLESIDDYLLSELGIHLPEPEQNTIQNRVFCLQSRDVFGKRFDPLYYSGNIYRLIEGSVFDCEYISKVTSYMKTGFASGKQDQSDSDQDIIQIRPTNINESREFVFARNIYIHKSELLNRKNDLLEYGEVLFNNTNSQELVGKSIFFDLQNQYFCSNHITRIGVYQEKIDPRYLTHIFNLYQRKKVFFKICTNWNNQSGVNVDVLGKVKIPIPPLEKQIEIADRITTIRDRAKQLRQEAQAELEKAKQEVEAMILGIE